MSTELEAYDAFPNAHGLSEELGLTRREDGTVPPRYDGQGRQWMSICSMHYEPKEGCSLCAVGSYEIVRKRRPR